MADHSYSIPIPPKSLRESINVATGILHRHNANLSEPNQFVTRALEHLNLLGRECDRKRPTGPDGTHGDRHTPECGCNDNPLDRHACPTCGGKGWSSARAAGREPVTCDTCVGAGWVPCLA